MSCSPRISIYMRKARDAAGTEAAGNYKHAAMLWGAARDCAIGAVNQVYCQNRVDTCKKMDALRGKKVA